jgi:hypothetical protein
MELIQAGRDSEESYRTCYNHLYNGLSESVRGQIDIMLGNNISLTSNTDKFNACAQFLWIKLINLKNREELPKKKLLSFEQAEKTLIHPNNGRGNRKGKYPPRDEFTSDQQWMDFTRKMMRKELQQDIGDKPETVLFSNQNNTKNTGKGCPFHKTEPQNVQHSPAECRLPVKFRKTNALQHKVCLVCLKPNHIASDCRKNITCKKCDARHSPFLCPQLSQPYEDKKGPKKPQYTGGQKGKKKFQPQNASQNSQPPKKQRKNDDNRPDSKKTESRPTVTSTLKKDPSETI